MKTKTLEEVHAGVRDIYNRALDAEKKGNFEYAVGIMKEAVKRAPSLLVARQKLRDYERIFTKKSLKPWAPFVSGVKTTLAAGGIRKLAASRPLEALAKCEDLLAENLNNPAALQLLADVATKADALFIAIESMQILHEYDQKNEKVLRKLAEYYREDGQGEEVVRTFQYLATLKPKDKKIEAELREAANAVIQQKNAWRKASAASNSRSVKEDAYAIQLEEGILRDADRARQLIDRYVLELQTNPSNELRRKLSEAYYVAGDFDKAIEQLNIVASKSAMDPALDKQIERTYLAKYNAVVTNLREQVKHNPAMAANLEAAERLVFEFRLEKAETRVKNFASSPLLHYDLGVLYYEDHRYDDAFREFEASRKSPQKRTQSTAFMGRCRAKQEKYEEALKLLDESLLEMIRMDKTKMETSYARANVLAKLGRREDALAAYQEIQRSDYKYRDVAQKIQEFGAPTATEGENSAQSQA